MVNYNPQLLLEAPKENVSEIQKQRYMEIPAQAVLANRPPAKRPEGMSFIRYWKNRRNANLAKKARERDGVYAYVDIDMNTMDVVTPREKYMRENNGRLPQLETRKKVKKPWRRKTRKGLKLAQGR